MSVFYCMLFFNIIQRMNSQLSGYSVVEVLGEGSFGTVFLVEDKQGKEYALKKIQVDPFKIEESQKQIDLISKFNHPNLIFIYDSVFERDDHTLKILMEYCEEGDLLTYFKNKKNRKMEVEEIITIFKQIVKGFLAMNAHGVVHRDLKPQNVLVCSNGLIKVADFGCARWLNPDDVTKIEHFSIDKGTAIYSSPQQLSNEPYSAKCDVWSAGCLLYFLYFNKHPFFDISIKQTLQKAKDMTMNKQIELPIDTHPKIAKILTSTLVYQDKQRATWRQLSLSRVLHRQIDSVDAFLIYIQRVSNIANWMTKQFWKVRKQMQVSPDKSQLFAYFMIKFQHTFNKMALEIINKDPKHAYLFTKDAYAVFSPNNETDEHIKEIIQDQTPRLQYFSSIREHMQKKQVFTVIIKKEKKELNPFADLYFSIRSCHKILKEILPSIREQSKNKQNMSLVWVLMSKWINFECELSFEKNCKIQQFLKIPILHPYNIIESQINKFEEGVVDF